MYETPGWMTENASAAAWQDTRRMQRHQGYGQGRPFEQVSSSRVNHEMRAPQLVNPQKQMPPLPHKQQQLRQPLEQSNYQQYGNWHHQEQPQIQQKPPRYVFSQQTQQQQQLQKGSSSQAPQAFNAHAGGFNMQQPSGHQQRSMQYGEGYGQGRQNYYEKPQYQHQHQHQQQFHQPLEQEREDFENQLAILRDQLELLAHTSNNPSGSGVEQGKTLPERPFAGWPFTRNGTASTTPMASNMHTPSIHYQPTPKLSSRGAYPFQNPFASSLPKADIPSSSSSSDFAAPPPRAPARNAEALHAPSVVGQSKAATLVGVARYPSADSDEQAHTASSAVGVVRYPVEANTEPNDQQKCVADANVGAVGVDGAAPRRKRTVITPAQPEEYNLYDVVIELPSAMCSPCISFCDTAEGIEFKGEAPSTSPKKRRSESPSKEEAMERKMRAAERRRAFLAQMELESATTSSGEKDDGGATAEAATSSSMALVGGGGDRPSPLPVLADIRASEADILSSWKVSAEQGSDAAVEEHKEITSVLMSSWKGQRDAFLQSCPVAPAALPVLEQAEVQMASVRLSTASAPDISPRKSCGGAGFGGPTTSRDRKSGAADLLEQIEAAIGKIQRNVEGLGGDGSTCAKTEVPVDEDVAAAEKEETNVEKEEKEEEGEAKEEEEVKEEEVKVEKDGEDVGPKGELEGPEPAEVSCTLKEIALPEAADVTLAGSANVSKDVANTSSRAHSLHVSLREGVSMRASMGEAVHVMLETSRELSSVVLGDGDAPAEVRKDRARRITADLQGLMSQLKAEHDEVVQQEECLEDGPWALGLQASGRAELADLTAEEIAASSNSGVQQGADHDDIYAARRVSSSTGGQGAAPIAQAVNASVDMYLSGGGNSRKSWGVGGMFSFEEIAMGLNDVTVHTLQGEEAEGGEGATEVIVKPSRLSLQVDERCCDASALYDSVASSARPASNNLRSTFENLRGTFGSENLRGTFGSENLRGTFDQNLRSTFDNIRGSYASMRSGPLLRASVRSERSSSPQAEEKNAPSEQGASRRVSSLGSAPPRSSWAASLSEVDPTSRMMSMSQDKDEATRLSSCEREGTRSPPSRASLSRNVDAPRSPPNLGVFSLQPKTPSDSPPDFRPPHSHKRGVMLATAGVSPSKGEGPSGGKSMLFEAVVPPAAVNNSQSSSTSFQRRAHNLSEVASQSRASISSYKDEIRRCIDDIGKMLGRSNPSSRNSSRAASPPSLSASDSDKPAPSRGDGEKAKKSSSAVEAVQTSVVANAVSASGTAESAAAATTMASGPVLQVRGRNARRSAEPDRTLSSSTVDNLPAPQSDSLSASAASKVLSTRIPCADEKGVSSGGAAAGTSRRGSAQTDVGQLPSVSVVSSNRPSLARTASPAPEPVPTAAFEPHHLLLQTASASPPPEPASPQQWGDKPEQAGGWAVVEGGLDDIGTKLEGLQVSSSDGESSFGLVGTGRKAPAPKADDEEINKAAEVESCSANQNNIRNGEGQRSNRWSEEEAAKLARMSRLSPPPEDNADNQPSFELELSRVEAAPPTPAHENGGKGGDQRRCKVVSLSELGALPISEEEGAGAEAQSISNVSSWLYGAPQKHCFDMLPVNNNGNGNGQLGSAPPASPGTCGHVVDKNELRDSPGSVPARAPSQFFGTSPVVSSAVARDDAPAATARQVMKEQPQQEQEQQQQQQQQQQKQATSEGTAAKHPLLCFLPLASAPLPKKSPQQHKEAQVLTIKHVGSSSGVSNASAGSASTSPLPLHNPPLLGVRMGDGIGSASATTKERSGGSCSVDSSSSSISLSGQGVLDPVLSSRVRLLVGMVAADTGSRSPSPTPGPQWGSEWLSGVAFFQGVAHEVLERVALCGEEMEFGEGQALCMENEAASGDVYVLRSGTVTVTRSLEGNQSCLMRTVQAPAMVALERLALRQMSHSTVRAASGGCTALSLPVGELGLLLGGSRANMDSAMRECHDVWQKDLRNLMKTRQVWQRLKDMRSMLSSLCIDISSLETLFRLPMASNPRTIPPQMSARIFGGIGRSSPAFLHLKSQVDEAVTSPVADLGKTIKLLSSAVMACLPPLKGYAANLVTAQMVLSDVPPAAAILIRNLESEAGCSLKDALCHPVSFLQRMCGIITTIARETPGEWDDMTLSAVDDGAKMASSALGDVGGLLQSLGEMRRLGLTPDVLPYEAHRRVLLVCDATVLPGMVTSSSFGASPPAHCNIIIMSDVIVVKQQRQIAVFYTASTLVVRVRGISGHDYVVSVRSSRDKSNQSIISLASEEDLQGIMKCYMMCVRQCEEVGVTPYSRAEEAAC